MGETAVQIQTTIAPPTPGTAGMPADFEIRPEDLVIQKRFARLWQGDEEKESQEIEKLAKSIGTFGQVIRALVTPVGEGKYALMDGHRRMRAVTLLNEKRTRLGKELVKLKVTTEVGGDLAQKAAIINIARKSYGPMELALRIQNLRESKQWLGFKGSKLVAEHLGVDQATVTQYERFLSVPGDTQNLLGEGTISAQSVLDMLKAEVTDEEQPVIMKRAREIQVEKDSRLTKRSKQVRADAGGKVKIERPAITKAIREVKGDKATKIALSRRELLDSIEAFDSPAYGNPDGAVRVFANYYVDTYAAGNGSAAAMRKKFTAMTVGAPKGKKVEAKLVAKSAAKPKKLKVRS